MSVAVQNVMRAICCPRLQCDLGALVQCRGTKVDARQLLSTVTEVSTGRGGNPGLSPRKLLSNVQRINAKTVTSLLILLSVLVCSAALNLQMLLRHKASVVHIQDFFFLCFF